MKRFFARRMPFWGVLALFLFGIVGTALALSFLQNLDLPYSIPLVDSTKSSDFKYGSEPALSNPDFFGKVKQEFIDEKTSFIEADLSSMILTLYQDGVATKEVPILTKGRPGSWWETPAGLYKIETKEKSHFSSFGRVYQPWSMAFQGNFFIHGWPYYEGGQPVSSAFSGGCIRLSDEDAKAIYDLASSGMPVLVFEKDFAPDDFSYERKMPELTASKYLGADLLSNFVVLKKDSEETIPLRLFGQFLGGLVAAEYINLEKEMVVGSNISLIESSKLSPGQVVIPYDLLHLMLIESSNEPLAIFGNYLGRIRFADLINRKAAAIGMKKTHMEGLKAMTYEPEGTTSPEELFRLAKYIYNNRSFLLKISSQKLGGNAYGETKFTNLRNANVFESDKRFVGGKLSPGEGGFSDFMGVFEINVRGEKRPLFIFLGGTTDPKGDVESILTYIENTF